MGYRVKGTLKLPDGSPASNAEIEFISRKNFSPLVQELKSNILCGLDGAYDVTLEYGEYAVMVYPGGTYPASLGTIVLAADTVAGQDLPTLLQQAGWQPATPEYIQQISAWLAEANSSASSSTSSAGAAKVSEANAKASENAALSSKNSAASSASTATTKATEAASFASAALASKNASATSEANSLSSKDAAAASASTAVAAADTASQKAADAAGHEVVSLDAATRAENAALSMVGAIIDGGECDLSGGVYPQPISASGITYSTVWFVAVGGLVSGIAYDVGDQLRYTTANSGYYFKVDAKDDVYSVNGEKGAVTVTPEKIGAEKTGVAQQLVDQHASKVNAHQISGVQGLSEALAGKESAGTTATAIASHEAKQGAHQVSGISGLATLIDAISPPLGCCQWDRARSNIRAGHVPSDGQILQRADYPDMWSAIAAGNVPVVEDSVWLNNPKKRGSFTAGNGTTTFRIPDENGKSPGSLGAAFLRGDGLNSAGVAGEIQPDAIRNFSGEFRVQSDGNFQIGTYGHTGPFAPRGTADVFNDATGRTVKSGAHGVSFDISRSVPTAADNHPVSNTGCFVVKVVKSSKLAGL